MYKRFFFIGVFLKFKKNNIKIKLKHVFFKRLKVIKGIKIEENSSFLIGNHFWEMGSYSYSHSRLPRSSRVGRYCCIARGVSTLGDQHPLTRYTTSSISYTNLDFPHSVFKNQLERCNVANHTITIKNDVWIGADSVLKPGITIGNGAVIAANAVVTKDVPDYAIVGGVPAKIIRYRFNEKVIESLLELKWWEYALSTQKNYSIDNIDQFILDIQNLISEGKLKKLNVKYIQL
jgi:acetyltransferase-like isoleucine patch superfamily enzyme